jgi:hypothetical protein
MPEPVPLPTTEDMEPFWHWYRFKDAAKEKTYQEACEFRDLRALRICAAFHAFFHLFLPAFHIYVSHDLPFGVCIAPILQTLISIAILLLSLLPALQKHSRLIFCCAVPFMAFNLALGCHWQCALLLQNAKQSKLILVYEAIGVHHGLLDEYLMSLATGFAVMQYVVASVPQILFWIYMGLGVHVVVSTVAYVCVACPSLVLLSGYAAVGYAAVAVAHVIVLILLAIIIATRARRLSFSLQQSFEEAHAKQVASAEAAQKADSILNHTLKNTMADAVGEIILFFEAMKAQRQSPSPQLQWAVASLQRGMRSCQQRQALIQLVSSTYSVALRPVRVLDFVGMLTAGRKVTVQVPDTTVLIDPTLCGLILDNAISNSSKHGDPRGPDVRLTVTIAASEAPEGRRKMLEVVITNAVNPDRPVITEEYVKQVLAGEVQRGPATSAMSNYIGLQHSFMAAEAAGMKVSLTQERERVVFRLCGNVIEQANPQESEDPMLRLAADFPSDLNIYFIDDSGTARRLVHHHLTSLAQTRNVRTFGQNRAEVDAFIDCALADGNIAILDQHLDFGADANVLGTEIIEQRLLPDFKGLLCIRSGNTAPEEVREYRRAGAHCVFGKDMLGEAMVRELKAAYVSHIVNNTTRPASSCASELSTIFGSQQADEQHKDGDHCVLDKDQDLKVDSCSSLGDYATQATDSRNQVLPISTVASELNWA